MFNCDPSTNHNLRVQATTAVLASLGSIAVLVSGCSATGSSEGHKTTKTISLRPNLEGFLAGQGVCRNGGARPCAMLLRIAPQLSAPYINTVPSGNEHVVWPQESYNGKAGDKLQIDCVTTGQKIAPYNGGPASPDWYGVTVPYDHIVNPDVKAQAPVGQPLLGFASVEYFGQSTPESHLPQCT